MVEALELLLSGEGLDPKGGTRQGGFREWIKRHHGESIDLVQVKHNNMWAPGPRLLDASRMGYFLLDDSRTNYPGYKLLHSTDGNSPVYVVYLVTDTHDES